MRVRVKPAASRDTTFNLPGPLAGCTGKLALTAFSFSSLLMSDDLPTWLLPADTAAVLTVQSDCKQSELTCRKASGMQL